MKRYLFCILIFASISLHGDWTRTYGGNSDDYGYSVQQTADGGYIIAGSTTSYGAGSRDVYLIKTNTAGDTLWTRTYGGSSLDFGYSVQQTADGGYIVAGLTTSYGAGLSDVYLIKTNAGGDTLWTRTYGGNSTDSGYSVQQTADGGYIVAGMTRSYGAGDPDVYLIKTNTGGDTLWTRTFGGNLVEFGHSVQQTADGGYIVAGSTTSYGAGTWDVYLIKTNTAGDTLWTRTYGGSTADSGYSVQQTADGGYIIAGYTRSYGAGYTDVYLIKTNAGGDTLWTRTYGGSSRDHGYSVQQTADGGYIIAGSTVSYGAGYDDVYLIKTNAGGDTLWTRTYGGSSFDVGYSVQQTADGGYIIAGRSASYGSGSIDVYLIRIDPPDSFSLLYPINNSFIASTNLQLFWNSTADNILNYNVYIDDTLRASTVDTSWDLNYTIGEGFHNWYVIATDSYLLSTSSSDTFTFCVDISSPAMVSLTLPENNVCLNDSIVQFTWNEADDSISGADHYQLKCALNYNFTAGLIDTVTTDTSLTLSLSDTIYYWTVKAVDKAGNTGNWSYTWTFTIDVSQPSIPALSYPVDGIFIGDTLVDFTWSEVTMDLSGNNSAPMGREVWKSGRDEAEETETPVRYVIELDTTATFTVPIYTDTLHTNGIELYLPEYCYYYWRVKAYDLAGNESPFSGIDSFGVDITAPVIDSTTVIPDTIYTGPFDITVKIIDNFGLYSPLIFYKRSYDPIWISDTLSSTGGDWYSGTIHIAQVEDTVKYYIFASDMAIPANESTDPAGAPGSYYSFIVNALGVEENILALPRIYGIYFNSPASNQIIFTLAIPEISDIKLKIYDLSGRLVSIPLNSQLTPGYHRIQFRPENKGVYFYTVESENFNKSGKFMIVE